MDKQHIIDICKEFDGKVCLFLKRNIIYSGQVEEYGETSLVIRDRYGQKVAIDYGEIGYIEKEDKKKYKNDRKNKDNTS